MIRPSPGPPGGGWERYGVAMAAFLIIAGGAVFLGCLGLLLHTLVWVVRVTYFREVGRATRPVWGDLTSKRHRWIP